MAGRLAEKDGVTALLVGKEACLSLNPAETITQPYSSFESGEDQ